MDETITITQHLTWDEGVSVRVAVGTHAAFCRQQAETSLDPQFWLDEANTLEMALVKLRQHAVS